MAKTTKPTTSTTKKTSTPKPSVRSPSGSPSGVEQDYDPQSRFNSEFGRGDFSRRDVFTRILELGMLEGKVPAKTIAARNWYREKGRTSLTTRLSFTTQAGRERTLSGVSVGEFSFFYYDPKTKADLPYYDTFPLVMPMEMYNDGFLGLNFHYLPLAFRAKLMDALYTISSDKRFDDKTKIKAKYQLLKSLTKFRFFRPCVKRYLYSHVRSHFFYIEPKEWDIALFLPWQNFKKASQSKVWADSLRMIR